MTSFIIFPISSLLEHLSTNLKMFGSLTFLVLELLEK